MTQSNQETEERPVSRQETVRIMRLNSGTKGALACVAILAVVLVAVVWTYFSQKSEAAATIALLEASNDTKAAELKKISDEREVAAKAEAAKAAAEAALPTIGGTFAVVTGTLFKLDQRVDAAAKSVGAFGTCKHNGQPLSFCFVEVGKKSTEVIAVPKTAMTEIEAIALAACFNSNLPMLDSGEAVGAFAQNLSAKRYAGKVCLTQ